MRQYFCPHCSNSWSIAENFKKHIYKHRRDLYFKSLRKRFSKHLSNFHVEASTLKTEKELIDLIKKQRVVTLFANLKYSRGLKTFHDMYENGLNVTDISFMTVNDIARNITIDTYKDFRGEISKSISVYIEVGDDVLYSYSKDIVHFFEIDIYLATKIALTKKLAK